MKSSAKAAYAYVERRRGTLLKIVAGVALAWLALAGLAAWRVPVLVQDLVASQVREQLGREARLEAASFNPFRLRLLARGLTVDADDGGTPLLTVAGIELNLSASSLLRLAPIVDAIRIDQPVLSLARTAPARFSVSDIVDRLAARPPSDDDGPARFSLNNVQVTGGRVTLDDRTTGRVHEIRDLQIGLPFLSTLSYATDIDVLPHLSALINDSPLTLSGTARPFDTPRSSELLFDLDDLGLEQFADAWPFAVPVRIERARLDADLRLVFEQAVSQPPVVRLEGTAALRELDVREADGAPLLTLARFGVRDLALEPLARRARAGQIDVEEPRLALARDRNGLLNLQRIAQGAGGEAAGPAEAPTGTPAAPWQVAVDTFALRGGQVDWRDDGADFAYALTGVAVSVAHVAWPAAADATPIAVSLEAGSDSLRKIAVTGEARLAPLSADLRVELDQLGLAALAPLWKPYAAIDVARGQASGQVALALAQGDEGLSLRWRDGALALENLSASAGKGSTLGWTRVAVTGAGGDLAARSASVDALEIQGLQGTVRRTADGRLAWADALQGAAGSAPPVAARPAAPAGKPAAPWRAELGRLALSGSSLRIDDDAVRPAAAWRLDQLGGEARRLTLAGDTPVAFSLNGRVQGQGRLAVRGTATPSPLAVSAEIDAQRLDLLAAAPYVADRLNASVAQLVAGARGSLQYRAEHRGRPASVSWRGGLDVTDLNLRDKVNDADFLRWKRLHFARADVSLVGDALTADLGDIALEDFFARVILSEKGRLNLQEIVASPGEAGRSITDAGSDGVAGGPARTGAEPAAAPETAADPARALRVGTVTLTRGNINFTDNFVKPNYTANLTDIDGSISAVSSQDTRPADVRVLARVDGDAPVVIEGQLQPLGPVLYTDIKASAKGVELPGLTPYAGKYAGYAIERGKLSMDVHYKIEAGKLQASNRLFLDQLTFGERVDSPDALKLPVQLAVALLKNSRGEIDIELPISGSLDDPQFSIGGIIVRALVNLVVRAVTAPFSLLASAFGGSGEELSSIAFAPGSAALDEAAGKRVATLVKALKDRPGLRLDVAGLADPSVDEAGLRRACPTSSRSTRTPRSKSRAMPSAWPNPSSRRRCARCSRPARRWMRTRCAPWRCAGHRRSWRVCAPTGWASGLSWSRRVSVRPWPARGETAPHLPAAAVWRSA